MQRHSHGKGPHGACAWSPSRTSDTDRGRPESRPLRRHPSRSCPMSKSLSSFVNEIRRTRFRQPSDSTKSAKRACPVVHLAWLRAIDSVAPAGVRIDSGNSARSQVLQRSLPHPRMRHMFDILGCHRVSGLIPKLISKRFLPYP